VASCLATLSRRSADIARGSGILVIARRGDGEEDSGRMLNRVVALFGRRAGLRTG
jgi:hypothetical protein